MSDALNRLCLLHLRMYALSSEVQASAAVAASPSFLLSEATQRLAVVGLDANDFGVTVCSVETPCCGFRGVQFTDAASYCAKECRCHE